MRTTFLNTLFIALLALIITPTAFAGIPISEAPVQKQETITTETSSVEVKKVSKLKQRIAKKLLKKHMADGGGIDQVLAVVLAILLPPLAVYLWQDGITTDFWIDLVLTLLFVIPGVLYALYVVLIK